MELLEKKIVYIDESRAIGGAEEYLKMILEGFRGKSRLYLVHPDDRIHNDFYRMEQVTRIPVPPELYDRPSRLFARYCGILREVRPDLMHVNLPAPNYCRGAIVAAPLCAVPSVIATNHLPNLTFPRSLLGLLAGRGVWDWVLWRLVFRIVDLSITVSRSSASALAKNYPVQLDRVKYVYNGVDFDRFASVAELKSQKVREEFGVQAGDLLITSVGRLHAQKGYQYLLAAVERMAPQVRNFKLLLVGDGPLLGELTAQARDLGLQDRVLFAGRRSDIPEILAASDIYVNSSLFEGLPFSILEAMAAGLAVVATAVDGNEEVLLRGKAGVLVQPLNAQELADALTHLVQDEKKRELLSRRGQSLVLKKFTVARMLENTERLYRETAAGARAASEVKG